MVKKIRTYVSVSLYNELIREKKRLMSSKRKRKRRVDLVYASDSLVRKLR